MIKAIIFDFGRVISCQKPPSLFRRYENDLGLVPGSINKIMFESRAWQEALVGLKTCRDFWHAIGPLLGLKQKEQIDSFRRRYYADESANPLVVHLIRRLRGPYKLAVLSNSPPGLETWLTHWKLRNLFDVVFCSGDEGVAKPDRVAFEITLARLRVGPEEAVFVDDTRVHVAAARSMGLHAVHFTTGEALAIELGRILPAQNLAYR